MLSKRSLPVGAELITDGVSFRVWTPKRNKVEVIIKANEKINQEAIVLELESENNGYFSLVTNEVKEGSLYSYRLDGSDDLMPDPASRFQPEGPHGPSELINHDAFDWHDEHWEGIKRGREVIYEMHIGTFTEEGTFASAIKHLKELAEIGITIIEVMPIADFPGKFGWGYDGVNLYAPTRLYGRPDDFRNFVNEAHQAGVGVILDVVYNHLGPDGNYLPQFSPFYFSSRYKTDWGDSINFDGAESEPVREYFIENAGYWIDEFHLDGLRLDATQDIHDTSAKHIIAEMTQKVREKGKRRSTFIAGENEPQQVKLIKPIDEGGYGIDALWNDDFHHSAIVALTGKNEAYYTDYLGKPQEFISALKYGYLFQGQFYSWQKNKRGSSSLDINTNCMIHFIENHDQVANSARGQRVHQMTSPSLYRTITALQILSPAIPLLFQGQEYASTKPFYYFADHNQELAKTICSGREVFLSQFRSIATPEIIAGLPEPGDIDTFKKSKLDHDEKKERAEWLLFHKELLSFRANSRAFNRKDLVGIDGAVLNDSSFLIRFFLDDGLDRLMLVNMGTDFEYSPAPEPLIAPPEGMAWELVWSSEFPRYGGNGVPEFDKEKNWIVPGRTTNIFKPVFKGGVSNALNHKKDELEK